MTDLRELVAMQLCEPRAEKYPCSMCLRKADAICSLIAAEKARGPDPLLVQAREALERYDKIVGMIHYTHPHLGWSDEDGAFIKATFAVLNAYFARKPKQ